MFHLFFADEFVSRLTNPFFFKHEFVAFIERRHWSD